MNSLNWLTRSFPVIVVTNFVRLALLLKVFCCVGVLSCTLVCSTDIHWTGSPRARPLLALRFSQVRNWGLHTLGLCWKIRSIHHNFAWPVEPSIVLAVVLIARFNSPMKPCNIFFFSLRVTLPLLSLCILQGYCCHLEANPKHFQKIVATLLRTRANCDYVATSLSTPSA